MDDRLPRTFLYLPPRRLPRPAPEPGLSSRKRGAIDSMFRDETEAALERAHALERELEALEASNQDKQSTIDQLAQQLEAQQAEIERLRAAATLEHELPGGSRRRTRDSDPTIRRERRDSDAHKRRPRRDSDLHERRQRRDSSGQHTAVGPRRGDVRSRRRLLVLLFAVGTLVAAAALALLTASC